MKFAIISDIHLGEEKESKGVIRKLTRYSKQFLQEFIEKMNVIEKPEFVANLGDSISDAEKEIDIANLTHVRDSLNGLSCPVYNLVGNHEQWTLNRAELQSLLNIKSLHYSVDCGDYHIVILFSEAFQGEDPTIGEQQRQWLLEDLANTTKKTLVFVHHSLAEQDLIGNFWFEGRPNRALIENRDEIRRILEDSGKVVGVFNGHVHWNRIDVHNGIPYFTINSIVENFKNDGMPSGSFALVDVTDERIEVEVRGADSAHYEFMYKN
jgi:alkaline phosphatase